MLSGHVAQKHREARAAAAKMLQHEIKTFVGSRVEVDLKPEGGIERSVGKARRVVDQRPWQGAGRIASAVTRWR